MSLELRRCNPGAKGHGDTRGDGLVHIEGSGICGTETLCGYVDTSLPWESVPWTEPVTCAGCWEVYSECKATAGLRRKKP